MIDPTGLQDLPDMVQLALMACDKPPKALAIELKCSISAVYQSLQGTRTLPASAMRKFAKLNLIASSAMAMQATGFKKLFKYRKSDRHIQSRLVELKMFDKRADEAMNMLPELLFNKNSPKDLTDESFPGICQCNQHNELAWCSRFCGIFPQITGIFMGNGCRCRRSRSGKSA